MKKNKIYIFLSFFFVISNFFAQNAYANFIESGDTIIIDTRTMEYVKKI